MDTITEGVYKAQVEWENDWKKTKDSYSNDSESWEEDTAAAVKRYPFSSYYGGSDSNKEAKRTFVKSQREIRDKAASGDVDAQIKLGNFYSVDAGMLGGGVKNPKKEAYWYSKAAKSGNADAQLALGIMYEKGEYYAQDNNAALEWYEKAAAQNNGTAIYCAAMIYYESSDYTKAARYFHRIDDSFGAQEKLANMYAQGLGVPRDAAEARKWRQRAEETRAEGDRTAAMMAQTNALIQQNAQNMLQQNQQYTQDMLRQNQQDFDASERKYKAARLATEQERDAKLKALRDQDKQFYQNLWNQDQARLNAAARDAAAQNGRMTRGEIPYSDSKWKANMQTMQEATDHQNTTPGPALP